MCKTTFFSTKCAPMYRWALFIALLFFLVLNTVGCTDADIASHNLSKAAEQFEVNRRIVFINVMADTYILSVEGFCSIKDTGIKVVLTCKTGEEEYKNHQMGRTETVTYFSEQLDAKNVSAFHYRVIFKPQSIIPNIDLETSVTN